MKALERFVPAWDIALDGDSKIAQDRGTGT